MHDEKLLLKNAWSAVQPASLRLDVRLANSAFVGRVIDMIAVAGQRLEYRGAACRFQA